ncbi:prefoldin chaperone subunit family protein [Citrus sinensis]|uniref:Prefoldin chaperone subunit family protein n=1 Tax=Citrus sinensis TaxID=2711 RepID=A0ACB8N306_CITSI|nr:prefoldin chaperone subunit family protein [Citrus sinensis]
MEEPTAKGTVTSISSMFPVDDVQKAAKRVQDALSEKQQELEFLLEKQHFFLGVLLGEGYYAERTSKQTVEILKRRGKVLDSQVDSLKAMMKDLQAEASFFDTKASEAAEGLVEIREEYGEENLSERASESGLLKQDSSQLSETDNLKDEDADEEYARIMSRLDELEKEELAWEIENGSAESKQNNVAKSDNAKYGDEDNELEEAELAAETENRSDENKQNNVAGSDNENNEDEQANTVSGQFSNQISLDHNLRHSECTGLTVQAALEDAKPRTKSLVTNVNVEANSAEKALVLPKEDNVATAPLSIQEAFTESIIEHNYNLQTDQQEQIRNTSKPSGSQSSKPVSRFKMQRKDLNFAVAALGQRQEEVMIVDIPYFDGNLDDIFDWIYMMDDFLQTNLLKVAISHASFKLAECKIKKKKKPGDFRVSRIIDEQGCKCKLQDALILHFEFHPYDKLEGEFCFSKGRLMSDVILEF